VDKATYEQPHKTSPFTWELSDGKVTALGTQSRMFLNYVGNGFPIQMIEEPARIRVVLDLLLTHEEEMMANTAKNGIWSSSEHEVTEFRIQKEARKGRSKIRTLDLNEADFGLRQ